MLKKEIVKKHINVDDIQHIIGHNRSIFIRQTIKIIFLLFLLYLLYTLLSGFIKWDFLPWIFGIIGIIFFVKYFLDFLNLYLDSLILSKKGITLFMREGLTKYKTDFFEREKIQTVSHTQNSGRDKIFGRGNLVIRLEHEIEFPFENISYPSKQVSKILHMKERYLAEKKIDSENFSEIDKDKIAMLNEVFIEVVKEYVNKKNKNNFQNEETTSG